MASCGHCGGNLFYRASEGALLEEYCLHCEKPKTTVISVNDGIPKHKTVELPWGEPDNGRVGTLCEHDGSTYVWSTYGWVFAGTKDEGFVWPDKKRNPNSRRAAILAQRERKRVGH